MSGPDQDFEDFLQRRRPLFRRDVDDGLEPPPELDRVVLRQAREAIHADRPMRPLGMPRWAAPVAIAATLVLGLSIVFKAGMPTEDRIPQVTVENVAQRIDLPAAETAAAPPPATEAAPAPTEGPVVVDLASPRVAKTENSPAPAADAEGGFASQDEARRHAPPAPPSITARHDSAPARRATVEAAGVPMAVPPAGATEATPWRRDARSWLAEIERLRTAGDATRADAEQAEYNRQQRAYAVAPDR